MSNSSLTIDLGKFRRNLASFRQITSARMLLVVKANAYGHGALEISRVAVEEGIDALGVVNTDELSSIVAHGVKAEIFLLGVVDIDDFPTAVIHRAHIPVWRPDQLHALNSIAGKLGLTGKFQIKIDTGMGRLGIFPQDLAGLIECGKQMPHIKCTGIYSHFFESDADDLSSSLKQMKTFEDCVSQARRNGLDPDYIHIANSPATIRMPASHCNLVRLGIAAYGLPPASAIALPAGVEPIASWSTKLLNIKVLPAGHGISYGAEYRTTTPQKVGVIPVGYADGFHRHPSGCNSVLIRGTEVPVLGRVCMDQMMIDLANVPEAALGDEVTLIGRNGKKYLSPETLAIRWGTNNYDVVANIGSRVERNYID